MADVTDPYAPTRSTPIAYPDAPPEPVGDGPAWASLTEAPVTEQVPAAPPPIPPVRDLPSWGPPAAPPAPAPTAPGPRPGRRGVLAGAVAGALAGALAATGVAVVVDDDPAPVVAESAGIDRSDGLSGGTDMDVQAVLDAIAESVVAIEVQGDGGGFRSAGTGVIIDESGIVLTNAHVVDIGRGTTVRFHDGTTSPATLIGSFPGEDIALVQLAETEGIVAAELGDSAELEVGDDVLAIGNALDLSGQLTVTRGIVSALDRQIEGPAQGGGVIALDDLIQTDAAINPGNSGGPLVDANGTVVGINTAIIADAQSVGFAIAIDALKPLIEEIQAGNGDVTADTAFLGVSTTDAAGGGAVVASVVPGSAADDAGIEVGDVILEIDGEPVRGSDDLRAAIRDHEPGDTLDLTVRRGGRLRQAEVTLGAITD